MVTETSAETCEGTSETLQITIDDCTGIDEKLADGISIYPNPAKDKINISFDTKEVITFEINIFNQFGQKIYAGQGNQNEITGSYGLDISSLISGYYYLIVSTSSSIVYQSGFEVIN